MDQKLYELMFGGALKSGVASDEDIMKLEEEARIQREFEQAAQDPEKIKEEEKKKDKRGLLSKAYDQLNVIDSGRSFDTANPGEDNKKNTLEQVGDVGRFLGRNTAKIANSTGEGVRQISELGRALTAEVTGDDDAKRAAFRRANSDEMDLQGEGRGLLGVGGIRTNKQLDEDSFVKNATATALTGAGAAGEIGPIKGFGPSAKLLTKVGGRAAEGALGNVAETALQDVDNGDEDISLADYGKSAAAGAATNVVLGGLVDWGTNKISGKTKTPEAETPSEFAKLDDDAAKLADDLNAADEAAGGIATGALTEQLRRRAELGDIQAQRDFANSSTVDESKLIPERTGENARSLQEVEADIQRLQTEGDPNLTPAQARDTFVKLQEERATALQNEAETGFQLTRDQERQAFQENGLPNDLEGAQKTLDDLEAGNVPETAKTADTTPVATVAQVWGREDFPVEVRTAAQQLMDDHMEVRAQMQDLITDETYVKNQSQMDAAYKQREAEIAEMPGPRQEIELAKLNEQYTADLDELAKAREFDAPKVQELNQVLDNIESMENKIVEDANLLMRESPDNFRTVDEVEVGALKAKAEENLTQAQKFNDPQEVVDTITDSPNPEKALNDNPEAQTAFREVASDAVDVIPVEQMEASLKETFKNPNINALKSGLTRFASPSKWLEDIGLRGKGLDIHSKVMQAVASVNKSNKRASEMLTEIRKSLPDTKEGQAQIIDFIEGKRETLSVIKDANAAKMIQDFLGEYRTSLQGLGFKTLDDYFPHMFDKKSSLANRFADKATGEISVGSLKRRLGEGGDYNKDIVDVLAQYASSVNSKIYMEPALKNLESARNILEVMSKESDAAGRYAGAVDTYMTQLRGKTGGKAFNAMMDGVFQAAGMKSLVGKNHYAQSLGTQRMLSAMATMGLNLGTAVRNMTQMVNTVAEIGPKDAAIGFVEGTKMLFDKAGKAELRAAGIFDGGIGREHFHHLQSTGPAGKIARASRTSANLMMSMIQGTDVLLRSQSYAGAKAAAIARGDSLQEAVEAGIRATVDTQFVTSAADMPAILNGDGVRSLAQLATFSYKQAEFLKNKGISVVKDGKDWKLNPKQAGNLLAASVVAFGATEGLKPMMGFQEKEWIPFYDQIAPFVDSEYKGSGMYRSPLIKLLAGDGKADKGFIQSLTKAGQKDGGVVEWLSNNWNNLVPAGGQIKKTVQGLESTSEGVSRNSEGNVRFLQDMGLSPSIQSALFGQYSTGPGRDWIQEGFPTLKEKQTKRVDEAKSREEKEQLVDFYNISNAVSKQRSTTYDEIKKVFESGNMNQAIRLAQEHNAGVKDALEQYYSQQDAMSPKMREEMEKLLIYPQRVYENYQNSKKVD